MTRKGFEVDLGLRVCIKPLRLRNSGRPRLTGPARDARLLVGSAQSCSKPLQEDIAKAASKERLDTCVLIRRR